MGTTAREARVREAISPERGGQPITRGYWSTPWYQSARRQRDPLDAGAGNPATSLRPDRYQSLLNARGHRDEPCRRAADPPRRERIASLGASPMRYPRKNPGGYTCHGPVGPALLLSVMTVGGHHGALGERPARQVQRERAPAAPRHGRDQPRAGATRRVFARRAARDLHALVVEPHVGRAGRRRDSRSGERGDQTAGRAAARVTPRDITPRLPARHPAPSRRCAPAG
jgi:hypothetical protein